MRKLPAKSARPQAAPSYEGRAGARPPLQSMPDRRRRRGGLRRRSDGSNPRGLADLGLEHAQDALELGTGYEACRLSAALAVKLEAKTLALLADRHALDELGRGGARLERLSGGYRH